MTVEDYYVAGKRIPVSELDLDDPAQRFLMDCSILCNDSTNENGVEIGDPTETALIHLASQHGLAARKHKKSLFPREGGGSIWTVIVR